MRNLFLAALLGVWTTPLLAADPPAEKGSADQTITTIGTGKAPSHPDTAEIRMEVCTKAASAAAARTDNKTVIEALLRRLQDLGVARRDVQVNRLAVVPQLLQNISDVQEREVVGYKLTSEVRVKVRVLDRLDKVVDDLTAQGPGLVRDVRLVVDDPKGPWDQASRKAMADARRKAEQLAREAGVELGEVLHVEQQQPEKPSSYGTDRKQPADKDYSPKDSKDYTPPASPLSPYQPSTERKQPADDYDKESAKDDYECRVVVSVTYAVKARRTIESKSPPAK
jgi:uncharacterized protein YggE